MIEQQLTVKQRQQLESRLANYNIPFQIFEMVAEQCNCNINITNVGKGDLARRPKITTLLAALNDRSIILLQQIFLECQDSFSNFRFAAFLSSKYSPISYKFVMNEKVGGKSGMKYTFDICVHKRQTEELVAVGMQNRDEKQQPSDNKSLRKFLSSIEDLYAEHPSIQGAYYASSYGYQESSLPRLAKHTQADGSREIEIKFLEYKDSVYFENKP